MIAQIFTQSRCNRSRIPWADDELAWMNSAMMIDESDTTVLTATLHRLKNDLGAHTCSRFCLTAAT